MIAKIIVDYKARAVDRPFDYLVPPSLEGAVEIGSRVVVPFTASDREVEGFCVGFAEKSGSEKLKSILRAAPDAPAFDGYMLRVIEWMHKEYLAPYIDIIRTIVPAGIAAGEKKIKALRLAVTPDKAAESIEALDKKAPNQAKILRLLCENEFAALRDVTAVTGASAAAAAALEKKGLVESFPLTVDRDPYRDRIFPDCEKHTLTAEQENAAAAINASIEKNENKTYLLHGVTGSGKTEVFMTAIEKALSLGRTALVLVPEISLTPQLVSRFMSRFGGHVAVFHSALSQGERFDQWRRIRESGADIVIGARSAVFTPLKNIGVIIMDEEHSDTYKSEMTPRYHAREAAALRAGQYGAPLVLASATPSVESYYKAKNGEYILLEMNKRYNSSPMPEIIVSDMRGELARGNRSMLSRRLYAEISENLKRGEQTILFLNRRGFSTFVSCRTCGCVPQCPHCSISLTYHKYDNNLKCHYCGYSIPNYVKCPECGSKYIRYFGGGTQKVEEEIKRLFPTASTIRMDMDTTGKKQSHEKILGRFEKEKIDILIGTQMVAKGLDFANVTLVGVISADTMLHIDDFRSGERTFAMLEQVSGRAGRGERHGRAVIQTYTPEHDAVRFVTEHDYKSFYEREIEERRAMRYPPFCEIVAVQLSCNDEKTAADAARYFLAQTGDLRELKQEIQVLGPIPAYISKVKNKYRMQILFKCESSAALLERLASAETAIRACRAFTGTAVVIDKSPAMMY